MRSNPMCRPVRCTLVSLALAIAVLASAAAPLGWRAGHSAGAVQAAPAGLRLPARGMRVAAPIPPAAPPTPDVPLRLGRARFSLFVVNPRFSTQNVEFT